MDHLQQLGWHSSYLCVGYCSRRARDAHLRPDTDVCARGRVCVDTRGISECVSYCWGPVSLDEYFGAGEVESGGGESLPLLSDLVEKMADVIKSYCCGVINVFAWIAICAGIAIIVPQLVLGMAIFWNSGYAPEPWHAFMLYQGANLLVLVYNIYVLKRSMWIHDVGCE
jgi:hypothetical protein